MRLLAASDIHLGRIPSLPSGSTTGSAAWEAVITCALEQRVEALLLAGDVVENDSAWFEAYGPLKKGLARLRDHGIQVIAVAGNHDARVFPSLAEDSEAVRILGLGGRWEAHDLGPIRILGWSFPAASHTGNPLETFPEAALAAGGPYLGLLHCDLDARAGSPYAPVPSRSLEGTGAAAWILGHIHRGECRIPGKAHYCGSPFALDAGEEGEHGALLLEIDDPGNVRVERLTLSPWSFRTLDVDLEGTRTPEEVRTRLAQALEAEARKVPEGAARTIHCSLRLRGGCALTGTLQRLFQEDLPAMEILQGLTTLRTTGRIDDATHPPLDLPRLAQEKGIRASLARIILQCGEPGAEPNEIPALLGQVMALLPAASAHPEAARTTLATAARSLLMTLEAQRQEA